MAGDSALSLKTDPSPDSPPRLQARVMYRKDSAVPGPGPAPHSPGDPGPGGAGVCVCVCVPPRAAERGTSVTRLQLTRTQRSHGARGAGVCACVCVRARSLRGGARSRQGTFQQGKRGPWSFCRQVRHPGPAAGQTPDPRASGASTPGPGSLWPLTRRGRAAAEGAAGSPRPAPPFRLAF